MSREKFEGGGLSEGEGRFRTTNERAAEEVLSRAPEEIVSVSPVEAEAIMGREQFFGPNDVTPTFGVYSEHVLPIPFSKKELERAKELGQHLVFQVDTFRLPGIYGSSASFRFAPFTLENLYKKYKPDPPLVRWRANREEFRGQNFWKKETPRPGWRLVTPTPIPGLGASDYFEQIRFLTSYLQNEVYKGEPLPVAYRIAIEAFRTWENEWGVSRRNANELPWQSFNEFLKLPLLSFFLERPVEVAYRLFLEYHRDTLTSLDADYVLTGTFSPSSWTGDLSMLQIGSPNAGLDMYYRKLKVGEKHALISFSRGETPVA